MTAPVDVLAVFDELQMIACDAHDYSAETRTRADAARAFFADLIAERDALRLALAKLVCEPGHPEYQAQARAALARFGGGA